MEAFPWQAFSVATAGWVLFALTATGLIRSIMTGRIVPRQALDDALHDRNEWRAESRLKDQQIAEKDLQLRHMAEVGETHKSVLTALSKLSKQEPH